MDINYFSKGGNYPYQAEGIIDEKYYFYFRARHNRVSLELYESKKDLDNFSDCLAHIIIKRISLLTDKEANTIIKKLYNRVKNLNL